MHIIFSNYNTSFNDHPNHRWIYLRFNKCLTAYLPACLLALLINPPTVLLVLERILLITDYKSSRTCVVIFRPPNYTTVK